MPAPEPAALHHTCFLVRDLEGTAQRLSDSLEIDLWNIWTIERCMRECRTIDSLEVPPMRKLFVAEVVATSAMENAVAEAGRLLVANVPFFGMTAGSGEHNTMGERVGNIGVTLGPTDIER